MAALRQVCRLPAIAGRLSTYGNEVNAVAVRSLAAAAAVAAEPKRVVRYKVTMIPGDGVGPELMESVRQIFQETGIPVDFEEKHLSEIDRGRSVPISEVVDSVQKNNGVCLKGVTQSPYKRVIGGDSPRGMNTNLRRALDLFANVVHIKSIDGIPTRHANLDFIIVREQTEGEYAAVEHETVKGVIESLKIMTRPKCLRIAKFAFDYATKLNRKKVTAIHKANIMKLGDGLFLQCCKEVSELYPHLEFDNMIIDNACMQLTSKPEQFDVLVTPNLYGAIIGNLAAGLVGGAGVVPGESVGAHNVIFEQGARHTFQHAMGRGIANPTAYVLAASNMLYHLGLQQHSLLLRRAVKTLISKNESRTQDIGGIATTDEFTSAIIDKYNELADEEGLN